MGANWYDIAKDDFEAARLLEISGLFRAAVNRYYYSAFHLLTGELIRRGAQPLFYRGRPTPGHKELPILVASHLNQFSLRRRDAISQAALNLYRRRETADYTLSAIDDQFCKEARRFVQIIVRSLEMQL